MRTVSKHDIAEIALVMVVLGFMFHVFSELALMISFSHPFKMGLWESVKVFVPMGGVVLSLALVGLAGILWKRKRILAWLFPDSDAAVGGVSVPQRLADFGFWVRLFGIWIVLSQSVDLIRYLFPRPPMVDGISVIQSGNIPSSTANIVLGVVLIWQASAIARFLGSVGHRTGAQSLENLYSDPDGTGGDR